MFIIRGEHRRAKSSGDPKAYVRERQNSTSNTTKKSAQRRKMHQIKSINPKLKLSCIKTNSFSNTFMQYMQYTKEALKLLLLHLIVFTDFRAQLLPGRNKIGGLPPKFPSNGEIFTPWRNFYAAA